jgi:uncharacterized membrane protein
MSDDAPGPRPPPLPSSPAEYINTLAHYHRAEIARMAGWRDRIDRTTNWAITVVAAMLSVSLSTPSAHHGVLIFAMVLVLLLLWIEARRYRFFDVYRARVRRMERHYFAQVFAPTPERDPGWAQALGDDLRRPRFLIGHRAAMSRRLRRNYGWMFMILLTAWVLKVTSPRLQEPARLPQAQDAAPHGVDAMSSIEAIFANAALGPLPGWLVILAMALFYGWLGWSAFRPLPGSPEFGEGDVHV